MHCKKYIAMRFLARPKGFAEPRPRNAPLGRFCPAGRIARGTGCSNPLFYRPHKIREKQKEQHPIRYCSWCARRDSNPRHLASEFPDTQRKTTISSLFASIVHKVENNIKSPRSLFRTGFAGFCMR